MTDDAVGKLAHHDSSDLKDVADDLDGLRARYEAWRGEGVTVTEFSAPDGTGFSSETFLATLVRDGDTTREVVRGEPAGMFPVFPSYDLSLQVDCMRALADTTCVPEILAHEEDASVLGRPFYVMRHVVGDIPTDNPPYTIMGWMHDAGEDGQRRVYRTGLEAMAALHTVAPADVGLGRLVDPRGRPGFIAQLGFYRDMHAWAAPEDGNPVIDAAFVWLDENLPSSYPDDVITWGDARVSNTIFQDGEAVALIDWEMAASGPGEIDLAWWLYMDRQFTDALGFPRLPGFDGEDALVARWEERVGRGAVDLEPYYVFAGLRFSVIMQRLATRAMATGAIDPAERVDHNNLATRLLSRTIGVPEPGPMGPMG